MQKLNEKEIQQHLESLPGWEYRDNAIETSLEFKDFKDAFTVMTRIAFEAESQNHHPEWSNVYNNVSIRLSTHDAGGVTKKDFELARAIEDVIDDGN
ncbi:4a-hydroxytetrahydrobiopterin dehydratase [Sungkyunkwania multivorans]|uniref:Putative pterin-4-alpha-carbinolamine dehydratase n=1 Tax=Sungkyunkwania multivorans TaxID=1173618 RepID=A0ABW3CUZ4_9FLAO